MKNADVDALQKMEQLKDENERLKRLLKESKRANKRANKRADKRADDSWDFKWDGRGSYEESRRCFYGDFS